MRMGIARIIRVEFALILRAPHQRQSARNIPRIGIAACNALDVIDAALRQRVQLSAPRGVRPFTGAKGRPFVGGLCSALQGLRWNRQSAVPVLIEGRGELPCNRTCDDDIVVGELRLWSQLQVLIAYIAPPPNERHCVVGDHQLVVHSIIEPGGIEEELHGSQEGHMASVCRRIEDADFDRRMSVKREDLFVARWVAPSSTRMRMRTSRSAARKSGLVSSQPVSSARKMKYWRSSVRSVVWIICARIRKPFSYTI
jgi:hypothetical protein